MRRGPKLTAPATALRFQLVVHDGKVSSSADQVQVTVNDTVNETPVANAGPDQAVGEQVLVQLSGAGSSDPNGEALTYAWSQVSGPAVTLSGTTAVAPTFTSPQVTQPAQVRLRLVVRDARGAASAPDEVVVSIADTINEPPGANAGPDATVNVPGQ